MDSPLQSLPPGWKMEVHSPDCGWPSCTIIITSPRGLQLRFSHQPDERTRSLTRQLQDAMGYRREPARP